MNLPLASVALFGVAALGGAFLAALRLKNKELPLVVALVHGVVAASGLVCLLIPVLQKTLAGTLPLASLGLFVVAALGGFVLFSFHLRKKPLPIPLMLVHAVVAVAGYATLLLAVFGNGSRVAP